MIRTLLSALAAASLAACAEVNSIGSHDAPEAAASVPAPASSPTQELLGKLVGSWVETGAIAGQNTVHDVEATWALQHHYVRITDVSRERGENGLPAYEATVFVGWLESANRYVCFWFDNTEVATGDVACSAAETPDSIPFEFRDSKGALIFTNTFAYNRAEDTWEWRLANVQDGRSEPFGTVTLHRR